MHSKRATCKRCEKENNDIGVGSFNDNHYCITLIYH